MKRKLLDAISSPKDIRSLSIERLSLLAAEIRETIIEVMSVNGGHLASNLGSIELTLALHYVFDSPNDKFVWDVGHQTYTHKILTNRKNLFHTIRQHKGLSGFSNPLESEHDPFHTGHAGTALSLSLGLLKARDLKQEENMIISIIGDATLTCGMSLEALNNVSKDFSRFLVILNDNRMSISQNVGAITNILSETFSGSCGKPPSGSEKKGGLSTAHSFSSQAFFEQFGLTYTGPIDGHNLCQLIKAFESIKNSDHPHLIHLHTNKGHGMDVARKNPAIWHGAKPFCLETNKFLPAKSLRPTFPKIFGDQILTMASDDPDLIAVTPAMSQGSCLDALMEAHPDRCVDVGIAESHAVTFSGALAKDRRLKVFCSIYATFLQRAFDNVFHDVCLQELPVVFMLDRAGIAGNDGPTHNGIYDLSFLSSMPNMVIAQPRNGKVLRELMLSAHKFMRPTSIRYPNLPTSDEKENLQPRELGKGEILHPGEDLLIIALGHMCQAAEELRALLLTHSIKAQVVDPVFLKPLDRELFLTLLESHTNIVTYEEHAKSTGLGSMFNNFLVEEQIKDKNVLNIGIPEVFPSHGSHAEILKELNLDPESVKQQILAHFDFSINDLRLNIDAYQKSCN